MAKVKSIPKEIKDLILDYGVQYRDTNTCQEIIYHVESILNAKPRTGKTPSILKELAKAPKKHVCCEQGGCKSSDCDKA